MAKVFVLFQMHVQNDSSPTEYLFTQYKDITRHVDSVDEIVALYVYYGLRATT